MLFGSAQEVITNSVSRHVGCHEVPPFKIYESAMSLQAVVSGIPPHPRSDFNTSYTMSRSVPLKDILAHGVITTSGQQYPTTQGVSVEPC